MRSGRTNKLLVEPPSSATGDIAFNLIVFFLVCASVQPDSGRKQTIPSSEKQDQEESENIEVMITRGAVLLNGNAVAEASFPARIKGILDEKPRPEDKIVVVTSKPDATYQHWIQITAIIEEAGGTITIQREEEEVTVID